MSEGIQQYLSFHLAEETYGIPILKVREIQGVGTVTKIPNLPDHFPGVINLRGAIILLVDLRRRFHLGPAPEGTRPVVLIVEVRDRMLGILADAVSDVVELAPEAVKAPPQGVHADGGLGREFILGLAPLESADGASMLILLDLDRMLTGDELALTETHSA